jgi:hypothetical protein
VNGSIQAEIFVPYQNNRRRDISYLVTELLSTEVPSLPPAQPFLRYAKYVVGRRWLIADALVPKGKAIALVLGVKELPSLLFSQSVLPRASWQSTFRSNTVNNIITDYP